MCNFYGAVIAEELIEDLDAVINTVYILTFFHHIWRGFHIGNLEKIAKQNSDDLLWFTKGVKRQLSHHFSHKASKTWCETAPRFGHPS